MNAEPTDAEINETIGIFCGWRYRDPSYTVSFDALREAMGKMTMFQKRMVADLIYQKCKEDIGFNSQEFYWLIFHYPARMLAEAVYQVVKGEK